MPRSGWGRTLCAASLLLAAIACGPGRREIPGSVAGASGAYAGAAGSSAGAGGWPWSHCCPPSERPGCCMAYGGFTNKPGLCLYTCDGMPSPGEGWKLGQDKFGCPVWIEPTTWTKCCGCLPPEAEDD